MLTVGERYGTFRVLKVDAIGRRALVGCQCRATHAVAVAALLDGS
jgi:hypothetical protein